MPQLKSATANHRIPVSRGIVGAQSSIIIENESDQSIPPSDLKISVDSPDGIFVDLGQAVERDGDFLVYEEIKPNNLIRVPVFIEIAIGREVSEEVIHFKIEAPGFSTDSELVIYG